MNDATQLALGLNQPFNNQFLFSDHYLVEILRREAQWTAAQPAAAEFLNWLRDLYATEGDHLPGYNEAQLEEHWFKPILNRLGHVWEPQASVPGLERGIKKPDYVFFPDDAARQAAVSAQRTEEYAHAALAVGEVKAWDVSLSRKTGGAAIFDNNNPMFQIDYYLKTTGAAWGIVGNGRLWRLVHKDSSYRLDRYFEIDLVTALTAADARQALAVATYFTLFFGRAAFAPDAAGRPFLDDVLAGSRAFAVALESDLRDNAYKALEQLILGFFAPAANGLDPADEGHRAAVYRNSLLLLYRLLFLFFGESRGLLPMGNPAYRQRSLTELARQAARLVDDHQVDNLPPMTAAYWAQFQQLFAIIDGRDSGLNAFLGVPRYNGGLFDPQRHEFLERKVVGERHLVRAVDYLARRRKSANGRYVGFETVDYRTLGVRQLGSIYEGLLEYKVSVASEAMVTVRKGGKETWLPARERGKTKVIETKQPGDLYLATDKGERKATGSYYTPDYIVKYIVEQTLGPLVEEAREKITNYELRMTNEEGSGSGRRSQTSGRSALADERAVGGQSSPQSRFEAAILSLNVLDPAMGSGHFLVEAMNYLARALATAEVEAGEKGSRGAGEKESAQIAATPVPPRSPAPLLPRTEDDLTYWKRRVVEACIYGVDKNELAVELAKLSLWLETVAADKPLSFLDHHLRHGDSLVGARLVDLERPPRPDRFRRSPVRQPVRSKSGKGEGEQGRKGAEEMLFDESALTTGVGLAVGGAAAIEGMLTDDLDAVHAKERLWADIHETHLGRWRRLADLWVSAWFGNGMSAAEYADLARHIQGRPGATLSDEQAARYLNHPAVVGNDYFHWELEFPEVFFDRHGRPKGERAGFDAVVGNPPYVRQEQLQSIKPFFAEQYSRIYAGTADLFVYFFGKAIELLRLEGLTSYISSNSWMRANYATNLRSFLRQNTKVNSLIDLGDNKVFADAPDLYPSIHIVEKAHPSLDYRTQAATFNRNEGLGDFVNLLRSKFSSVSITDQKDTAWQLENRDYRDLFDKLSREKVSLSEVVRGNIFYGIKTGLNDVFVITEQQRRELINEDQRSDEIIKPFISGSDLRPFYQSYENQWLIFSRRGIDIERYPAVYKYLLGFRIQLEPKPKDWAIGGNWQGRKPGSYKWFELQDSVDYFHEFEKPKIMWPDITKFPRFSWDETGYYLGNTGYILVTEDKWLLAYLNSRCAWYLISKLSIALGERAGLQRYRLIDQYMRPLPVPTVPIHQQTRLGDLADSLTKAANARFQLHKETRHRISSDLGSPEIRLNEKLTNWWEVDFATFRAEVKRVFKHDIPVKERSEWEQFLADTRKKHETFTAEIVRMETELNAIVYGLFDLTPAEIKIIEESTKYKYGEI